MASSRWTTRQLLVFLIICVIIFAFFVDGAYCFGAGNVPSFSFLEDKAFRHGDIDDCIAELAKGGAGFLGIGSKKFGGLDVKRIYFGSWLRDYSQAMDIAGLTKMSKQTIINLCMALGFLAHGYATAEFEVTEERLGVYLPVEHIDNPKGYGEGQDARKVHPKLRGPIDPRELEVDHRTGIKNYIANETGGWDTSSAFVRRTLLACIEIGRQARGSGNEAALYEAYRLLGTALHTMEDLCAHSNWCELSLRRLGYPDVFCHVGEAVVCQTPSGPAPPLITGTFGSADFMHSLLGEATDHISEASVSDLNKAMNTARSTEGDATSEALRGLLFQLPGSSGGNLSREMDAVQGIRDRAQPGSGLNATELSPQELHAVLWQVLTFRDNVCKTIERTIERIPGLSSLVETLTTAVNKFVFTTIEPYLKPVMQTATSQLQSGSAAVINKQDQYEVFNDPHASDPTHSLLSKDHFALILNEPAGNLAKIIVRLTVTDVVRAWDNTSINPHQVIDKALECFHHPYFVDGSSQVQREMGQYMKDWITQMPGHDKQYVLGALTKQAVRSGKNKRRGHVTGDHPGCGHANIMGHDYQSFLPTPGQLMTKIPGYNQANSAMHAVGFREVEGYGGRAPPESFSEPQEATSMPAHTPGGSAGYDGGPRFPNVDISTPAGYGTPFPGSEPPLRNDTFSGRPQGYGGYGGPPGEAGYGGPPGGGGYGGPPGGGGYDGPPGGGGYNGPPGGGGYSGGPPGGGGYGGGPPGGGYGDFGGQGPPPFPQQQQWGDGGPPFGQQEWDGQGGPPRPPPPQSWGYNQGQGGYPSGGY